ncbi:fungal-specific transcription factor domain-containing protein [Trichoderma austrokoningii]
MCAILYRDVLNRHRMSHEQNREETSAVTRSRACRQCAISRARCSRSEPCNRCFQRGLLCNFPATREFKATEIVDTRVDMDNEPKYPNLDAPRQMAEKQTREEIPLLLTGSDTSVNTNDYNPEGANDNYLSPRTNTWTQQPAMFELSQAAGSIDHGAQRIYEFNSIAGFNEQALDLLSMNWMSPEQSTSFGWNGLVARLPYAENDKSDVYMPFFFPNSGPLPDPSRQCVPPCIDHGSSFDSVGVSNFAVGKSRSEGIKSVAGSYYVDGDGSRAPFGGQAARKWRRRRMTASNDASTPGSNSTNYTDGDAGGSWEDNLLSVDGYESMIRQLHRETGKEKVAINANAIPSLECIAQCLHSYFEVFHPTFPFIRKATFLEKSSKDWMLLLAVAVVGSKYTTHDDEERLHSLSPEFMAAMDTIPMGRLCHDRLTAISISSTSPLWALDNDVLSLSTLQAATLFLICALHRGKADMTRRALLERHYVVGVCKELNLLPGEFEERRCHHHGGSVTEDWLMNQCRARTGLMIWLLDAMISYEFNTAPMMQLADARVLLPCQDRIWEYPSMEKVSVEQKSSVTLIDVIEMLYIKKRLPESLSEFSNILIIHGIWRKTKEVINQNQTRLANWIPSASIQARETQQSALNETWPPSSPMLSKWRNSACDCLDILHWRANSKAAGAGGLEHPTVMYLHLSRLILLTPVAHIQTLAANLANENASNIALSQRYAEASNCVLKWAMNDSFKARLAIIHAGSLFWHIRRYSRKSFLEPFAIYTATLVIWAYSISIQFAKQQEDPQAVSSPKCQEPTATAQDEELYSELNVIYVDRPCNDEMVQLYLRHGDKMSAHMTRVGVITEASAQKKILREGIRLLENGTAGNGTAGDQERPDMGTWEIDGMYWKVLAALAQVIEERST